MPISSEEAIEIYQHLLRVMNRTGYAEFARETLIMTQRDPDIGAYRATISLEFLLRFLENLNIVLNRNSNDRYDEIIRGINEHIEGQKIESLTVSSFEATDEDDFDLRELPSYHILIQELETIRTIIIENIN